MIKVFNLIGVPPDEKAAMRYALDEAKIPYYETPVANWGWGQPGFWVKSELHAVPAQKVLATAQEQWRRSNVKTSHSFWPKSKKGIRFLIFIIIVLIVVFMGLLHPGAR
jgi:hypothetical protein